MIPGPDFQQQAQVVIDVLRGAQLTLQDPHASPLKRIWAVKRIKHAFNAMRNIERAENKLRVGKILDRRKRLHPVKQ